MLRAPGPVSRLAVSAGSRSRSPKRRAFTLIELLVTLGIITVLVSVLLPALTLARRSARQVTCLSNLRQWATAVQAYAIANRGYLPRRGQGIQPTQQINRPQDWFNALPPMMQLEPYAALAAAGRIPRPDGARSVWTCPDAADAGGAYYWSYGMNMGLSVEQSNQNQGMSDKISGVGDAAVMVFMADAPGNYCSVFPSRFPGGYNPVPRHANRVNLCFLDGHAAAVAGSYMGVGSGLIEHPDIRWHPPGNTWNSAQ